MNTKKMNAILVSVKLEEHKYSSLHWFYTYISRFYHILYAYRLIHGLSKKCLMAIGCGCNFLQLSCNLRLKSCILVSWTFFSHICSKHLLFMEDDTSVPYIVNQRICNFCNFLVSKMFPWPKMSGPY